MSQTHNASVELSLHSNCPLNRAVHPALRFHTDRAGDVIECRSSGQRQLPSRRVRHELIEVVGEATRVGGILELGPERRVEREDVLIGLMYLQLITLELVGRGIFTNLRKAKRWDLLLYKTPAKRGVGDPDAFQVEIPVWMFVEEVCDVRDV